MAEVHIPTVHAVTTTHSTATVATSGNATVASTIPVHSTATVATSPTKVITIVTTTSSHLAISPPDGDDDGDDDGDGSGDGSGSGGTDPNGGNGDPPVDSPTQPTGPTQPS